ncbi:hypothetical protein D9M70_465260 [compost metagenome]
MLGRHVRTGHDPLDDHRSDHQCHDRVGRNAKGEQRDERGLRTGIVGAFRTGDAGDGAMAELFRTVRDALFHRIGGESSKDRAAAGQNAEGRADDGAAHDRSEHALEVIPRRHQVRDLGHQHFAGAFAFEVAQDFGDAEDTDGERDEVQPVSILPDAERETRRAGIDVGADQTKQQAQRHHGQSLGDRSMGERDR